MTKLRCVRLLLLLTLLLLSIAASAAPLANSYKSIINIKTLFPGSKTCPSGWIAVGDSGDGIDSFGTTLSLSEQLCANPATGQFFGEFKIAHSSTNAYFGHFNGTF